MNYLTRVSEIFSFIRLDAKPLEFLIPVIRIYCALCLCIWHNISFKDIRNYSSQRQSLS